MEERVRIYQLFVRHFGNVNGARVLDGSIEENGCGKFSDITDKALGEIVGLGFTDIWLTGVIEHASGTGYPGRPADDAVLLKGKAGSPYAVRDYFDVCPDYAQVPEKRLEEFQALLGRCADAGLRVIIDFIPNHVARSYGSDVRPELSFGEGDDVSQFFERDNHFYYLAGEGEIRLPAGVYAAEQHGRVTGNDAATWEPSIYDWYETVKLNYGHDYRTGRDTGHLPGADAGVDEVPRTWRVMDEVMAYWQGMGVGGFRCDMAHMVPMEFWCWAVRRARARVSDVYFLAEAYDGDPAKLTDENVLEALLDVGFDSVYDGDSYELVKELYEGEKWANDLDGLLWDSVRLERMLRYSENHDEVRLASPKHWGGYGMKVGRAVTAYLFGVGSGPVMVYNGQEVGEAALGAEGFGGDGGRTSIFDYWSLPELMKWVNGRRFDGGLLDTEQRDLRQWYGDWVKLMSEPAFARGAVYGLNHVNLDNAKFGRGAGEVVSGRWLYAFLRKDELSGQAFLVVVNFNPHAGAEDVEIWLSREAREWLAVEVGAKVLVGDIEACGVRTVEFWGDFGNLSDG